MKRVTMQTPIQETCTAVESSKVVLNIPAGTGVIKAICCDGDVGANGGSLFITVDGKVFGFDATYGNGVHATAIWVASIAGKSTVAYAPALSQTQINCEIEFANSCVIEIGATGTDTHINIIYGIEV
jgi:hypothetical protein